MMMRIYFRDCKICAENVILYQRLKGMVYFIKCHTFAIYFSLHMKYDFDVIVSREGTDSEKFDLRNKIFGRPDVIPMRVADMDFMPPVEVVEAVQRRAAHPIYGYTYRSEHFNQSVIGWVQRHGGWTLSPEWLEFTPGVVPGIVTAIRAFTREGDGIVIQPPVYHPFARQIRYNNRIVVNNPLRQRSDGSFEIDFEDLDKKLAQAKAFLMCNPQNPSGRVFTEEELRRIGELCVKHDVVILSDEIHGDLVYKPHRHLHIAALDPRFAERTVTFIAPSKTFNIAGFATAVCIVPNEELHRKLHEEFMKFHIDEGNIFGSVALPVAYDHGDEWLEQLLAYLDGNITYVMDFLREKLPSVRCVRPEGTYLMWLDFRRWPLTHEEIYRFLIDRAGIGVNEGSMFGEEGRGWMRLNIATQRSVVRRAMDQLYKAAKEAGYDRIA